jgi:acetylornithine deacetylase/succinyl-diaminopimelate desuccinylase-like protein
MANRNSIAFAAFVAPDAIFFAENSVMRGKSAVVDGWRGLFAVEVIASGALAHSSGPDPCGRAAPGYLSAVTLSCHAAE